jgi:hypothetical protein
MIQIQDVQGVPFKSYYYDSFPPGSVVEPDRELVKAVELAQLLNTYLSRVTKGDASDEPK